MLDSFVRAIAFLTIFLALVGLNVGLAINTNAMIDSGGSTGPAFGLTISVAILSIGIGYVAYRKLVVGKRI